MVDCDPVPHPAAPNPTGDPGTTASSILSAARRLSGHIVDTPVIGELRLPGFGVSAQLRIKAECLQMGGSLWFRGYLNWLLRSLGRYKGLVLRGGPRAVYAQAVAASLHRLPACAVVAGAVEPGLAELIRGTGCELHRTEAEQLESVSAELVRQRGYRLVPGLAEADVWQGVATIGVELAAQLPRDLALVLVSPEEFAAPVRLGLAAAGASVEVRGVATVSADEALASAVRAGLRLCSEADGLAALASQVVPGRAAVPGDFAAAPSCVILSC